MRWLFITAGVGTDQFEAAADRLANSVSKFELFDEIRVFKTNDVTKYAPEILEWHSVNELGKLKGYGWYVWKSRFALEAVSRNFGDFDGIMYLDAGCEAFLSYFSKIRLERYMAIAEETGTCLFKIPTPESFYTKNLVLTRFKDEVNELDNFQFQSGSWLLFGKRAREFISKWDAIVWEDPRFTDESPSPGGEVSRFICNRYDQAIFSMVARSFSINGCDDVPPGDITRLKPRLKLFVYPFAWSRNRSGRTIVPIWMKGLGLLTLVIYNLGKPSKKFKKSN